MNKERVFKFKEFSVSHGRSSMPIGVDGVLLGAWCETDGERVLDVGTGCGVIALMVTCRYPLAIVTAIDSDTESIVEALLNFRNSPWSERLSGEVRDWIDMPNEEKWDLIVSNPPFFDSGVNPSESVRLKARHVGSLSPASLIEGGEKLLSDKGRLAMILPAVESEKMKILGEKHGLNVSRITMVSNHEGATEKRCLMEFKKEPCECSCESLKMFETDGTPTEAYRKLTGRFYLNF